MTTVATNPQITRSTSIFGRLFSSLVERNARRRAYRTTRRELSALNDRELNDLGINRAMIEEISLRAAGGI